jgi:two-component system, sensor histidine kinase PdtaS
MRNKVAMNEGNCGSELDSMARELDHRVRNNLSVMLALVRLQSEYPPTTAAAALARVSAQISMLAALYDGSSEAIYGEGVRIHDWCGSIVASIARSAGRPDAITFSSPNFDLRLPMERAQSIGLAFGELLSDCIERARQAHSEPRVSVGLSEGEGGMVLRIIDQESSTSLPPLALRLAEVTGCEISSLSELGRTERELLFDLCVS